MKAEKIVTEHEGYTSIKYVYSRKPYITDICRRVSIDGKEVETKDMLYDAGSADSCDPQGACGALDDNDDLPFDNTPSDAGIWKDSKPLGYVSRAFCPFCGKVMEERWTEEEHIQSRGVKNCIIKMCACGHEVDMLLPALARFREERKGFGWRERYEDEERKERYEALMDAEQRVKYSSMRMKYVNLFDEKYDKVTAVIGYTVTYMNKRTNTPSLLNGTAKVIMNMKTGMTYIKNGRFFKKDCPEIVKLFHDNGLKSICYGMPSWISYGIVKREYGRMVIDTLEEPEVVKHFAENVIRYKGLDKSSLTQTGDFSDTMFAMVCTANNSPGYTYRSYAAMAHMKDFHTRNRIGFLKADMRKGKDFMAKKYFKDMPKSLRKIIAKDPFYFRFFKDLRTIGFTDPNVIKKIANEKPIRVAGAMICASEKDGVYTQQFVREYISRYGEPKAAKMLCSIKPEDRYITLGDLWTFYDAGNLFDEFVKDNAVSEADMSGKTIKEIHDNLSSSYYRISHPDFDLVYKNGEERFEKTVEDYEFRLPRTGYELADIGKKMHNCVAVYGDHIKAGASVIVTATKKSRYEMCIEIRDNTVVQARGNCNKKLTEKQRRTLNEWAKENRLAVEDRL